MINQTVGMQFEGNLQYIKQIILFCNVNMDRVTYTTVNSLLFGKKEKKTLCNCCMCILRFVQQGKVTQCVWVGALLKGCEEAHC